MATPVTTKRVNKALAAAGIDGEISKAEGVYYFVGPAFESCEETCLHMVSLQQSTPAALVDEAERMIAAAETFSAVCSGELTPAEGATVTTAIETPAAELAPIEVIYLRQLPAIAAVLTGRALAYVHSVNSGDGPAICGVGAGKSFTASDKAVDCPKCLAALKRAGA